MNRHPLAEKWDFRYADMSVEDYTAAAVLSGNQHLLPSVGRALDLASGLGPNALLLARLGLSTLALDVSPLAMQKLAAIAEAEGLPLRTEAVDLLAWPFPGATYDVITVSRFLERSLMPSILAALVPGGLLFYQTFTEDNVGSGPSNPDFLLRRGELLELCDELELVFYREDGVSGMLQRGVRGEAMLVGRRVES
jgi:SAM-dependent methyltransferase